MKNKGQEEIVGFIIIIIIMSIVALIFLAFGFRESGNTNESVEAKHLLGSVLEFTSDCAIGYIPAYGKISGLIRECNSNSGGKCVDGREVCKALNSTLEDMFETGIKFGENRLIRGYVFKADYGLENNFEQVIYLTSGNCSAGISGAEYPIPANPGRIITRIELCLN